MRQRITTIAVAAMTVVACTAFASTLVHASLHYQTEEEVNPQALGIATTTLPSQNREIPNRLIIPSLSIDTNVQDVGIGKSGNMAVPTNYTDVGWYRWGPTPGQTGSAVIDGHVDNGFGLDAVFKHMSELVPGDDIFVETKEGTRLHFIVDDIQTYRAEDVPTDIVFNRDDTARLNLITCAGEWLPDKKAYDSRVVVYAVLK